MSFTIPRSVDQFCRDLAAGAGRGGRSEALQMIVRLVGFTITSEVAIANVLSSRQLDTLCQELGQTAEAVDAFAPEQTVFLVTMLSRAGGHTRFLRDLIDADPGERVTVLVSNVMHTVDVDEVRRAFGTSRADIQVAPVGMQLGDTVDWMQDWLLRLRPERTYILQHHFDPVIPAAVQPALVNRLFYIHNCDHALALGVHIPHATHVDLHAPGFHLCRAREGVVGNVRWPLTGEAKARASGNFPETVTRTCTSGGREKFDTSHLVERIPYLLDYPGMVATILATTRGTHHHIGEMPPDLQADVLARLDAEGFDQSRFVHTAFVPSLSEYFVANDIHLYVASMPWGGGRALVEVMATGLPVLLHSNYRSMLLTDQCSAPPDVLAWRSYDELAARLRQCDGATLKRQADLSLDFYHANHRPDLLREAMAATLRGEQLPEPAAPTYCPDALQAFLDVHAAQDGHIRVRPDELHNRDARTRELEQAFRVAEKFAIERLAEMERMDKQLLLTDQALASVTALVRQREAEIEALRTQLRQAAPAGAG